MAELWNYAEDRADAEEMIAEAGQSGTLMKVQADVGPAYDPTASATVSYPCKFVVTEYSSGEIDGTRVRSEDWKVLVSTEGIQDLTIDGGDRLSSSTRSFEVVRATPLAPGGLVVLWTVQARG